MISVYLLQVLSPSFASERQTFGAGLLEGSHRIAHAHHGFGFRIELAWAASGRLVCSAALTFLTVEVRGGGGNRCLIVRTRYRSFPGLSSYWPL